MRHFVRYSSGVTVLVKPQVSDDLIIDALRSNFDILVTDLEFLPVGNDAGAWAYRVSCQASNFFLKLRRGAPKLAGLLASTHLYHSGIENVVAPMTTVAGALHARLSEYALALFPWICGESAWGVELTPSQYRQWGRTMRAIHKAQVTQSLLQTLPAENYDAKWLTRLEAVESAMARDGVHDSVARRMTRVWQEKQAQIDLVKQRYHELTRRFQARSVASVLCHADIHGANILIDNRGDIFVVDWDEAIIAPKERDLMFFINDGGSEAATAAFLDGYGQCAPDEIGLAYYRYDWVMQEFCDNGERVFLDCRLSATEREFAAAAFCRLFAPGDVVARAHCAYEGLQ